MFVGMFSLPGLLRGQILNVLRKLFQGDKQEAYLRPGSPCQGEEEGGWVFWAELVKSYC